jgi:hypothetical protein
MIDHYYGHNSFVDWAWWPVFTICVIGILNPWIDADKDRLSKSVQLLNLAFAIAAPLFAIYVLVLAAKKYGLTHAGEAVIATVVGAFLINFTIAVVVMVSVSAFRLPRESQAKIIRRFRRFPPPFVALAALPFVCYELLMMYLAH